MIPRYSRPEMARVWSEENKLDSWLRVEIAVCEAWAERGVIPPEAIEKIRRATLRPRARRRSTSARCTTTSTPSCAPSPTSLGDESRWVHLGLTSYDVEDTALALRLIEATELLEEDVRALMDAIAVRALEHKQTPSAWAAATASTPSRSPSASSSPTGTTRCAATPHRLDARRRSRSPSARSPAPSAPTPPSRPTSRSEVCGRLGLIVEPISTQVVHRDRHAYYISTLALIAAGLDKFATEIRHLQRTEVLRGRGAVLRGPDRLLAMPHKRNPEKCERICGLARLFRGYSVSAFENVALWHERDISHSSVERVILPDACIAPRLHARPVHLHRARHARLPRAHAREHRDVATASPSPSASSSPSSTKA